MRVNGIERKQNNRKEKQKMRMESKVGIRKDATIGNTQTAKDPIGEIPAGSGISKTPADSASSLLNHTENTMKAIQSQNKKYGFYGTTRRNGTLKIRKEWPAAFEWMRKAAPGWSAENIRDFLDSQYGRHLADEAGNENGIANVNSDRWQREFSTYAEEAGIAETMYGVRERITADKELTAAKVHLRTAMVALEKILAGLPPEGRETEQQAAMKSYAVARLDMIHVCLGGEY